MPAAAPPRYRTRLKKLRIRDFRGIESLDLDFTDSRGEALDLVVLAGDNGCGKTAVLEAGLWTVAPHARFRISAGTGGNVRFGADIASVSAEIHSHGAYGEKTTVVYKSWKAGFATREKHEVSVEVEYFSSKRQLVTKTPNTTIIDEPDDHTQVESRRLSDLKQRLISAYYRQLRQPLVRVTTAQTAADSPFDRLNDFWSKFNDRSEVFVVPINNDPGSGDDVVLIQRGTGLPPDVTSWEMARQLATDRVDIPKMVPLHSLSSGERALFAFAGPIIFRDKPLDIVFIDEPEQHLHVQWHRQIIPALQALSPSTQFIVATHSEEILQSALSSERFILIDRSDPRAVLLREDHAGEGDDAGQ